MKVQEIEIEINKLRTLLLPLYTMQLTLAGQSEFKQSELKQLRDEILPLQKKLYQMEILLGEILSKEPKEVSTFSTFFINPSKQNQLKRITDGNRSRFWSGRCTLKKKTGPYLWTFTFKEDINPIYNAQKCINWAARWADRASERDIYILIKGPKIVGTPHLVTKDAVPLTSLINPQNAITGYQEHLNHISKCLTSPGIEVCICEGPVTPHTVDLKVKLRNAKMNLDKFLEWSS